MNESVYQFNSNFLETLTNTTSYPHILLLAIALNCPANAHYELCPSACQPTCSDWKEQPCLELCSESCVCDDGFILEGEVCKPLTQCGCVNDATGEYYAVSTITKMPPWKSSCYVKYCHRHRTEYPGCQLSPHRLPVVNGVVSMTILAVQVSLFLKIHIFWK